MDTTTGSVPGPAGGLTRGQENRALVALALPVLLISMDATILGFAVPRLSEDLEPTSAELLWIIDIYSFVLSGLLITMGNVGDRIGRRRLLLYGAAAFSVASVAAAFAPTPLALIGARALLGVAGATLMPSTLSLIRNIFMDDRRRQFAVAVWATMFSVGAVVGPIIGGLLLEHYWWGSVFLVGVPVTTALLLIGPRVIPESRDPDPGPFDILSSALSMAAILPLVYGMKIVAERGWATLVAPSLVIGLVAGWAFVRRQRVLPVPMIDLSLFAVPKFRVAITGNLLTCVGFAGSTFFVTQYLQLVLGLSPTRAALQLLPAATAGVISTMSAPAMTRRFGTFAVITTGLATGAVGFLLLTQLTVGSSLVPVTVALVIIEAGLCAAITVAIDAIISSVPPEKAGAGASVSETANELGVALGTA
ncbi:MAG TPA: MFS transporter, partial [Acidimicrobiales bacterium]|nr:MFS transporter [Acidimicrobiales bacterium]